MNGKKKTLTGRTNVYSNNTMILEILLKIVSVQTELWLLSITIQL